MAFCKLHIEKGNKCLNVVISLYLKMKWTGEFQVRYFHSIQINFLQVEQKKSLICHGLRRIRYERLYIYFLKSTIKPKNTYFGIYKFSFWTKMLPKIWLDQNYLYSKNVIIYIIIIKSKIHKIKTYLEWDDYKWMLIININFNLATMISFVAVGRSAYRKNKSKLIHDTLTFKRQTFVTTCLGSTTSTKGSEIATLRIQLMLKPYTLSHPKQ